MVQLRGDPEAELGYSKVFLVKKNIKIQESGSPPRQGIVSFNPFNDFRIWPAAHCKVTLTSPSKIYAVEGIVVITYLLDLLSARNGARSHCQWKTMYEVWNEEPSSPELRIFTKEI